MLRCCAGRPRLLPTACRAPDLAFALEPGGAGAGAAGWGAVAAAPPAARLRDARPVAARAPCALDPRHQAPAAGARRAVGEGMALPRGQRPGSVSPRRDPPRPVVGGDRGASHRPHCTGLPCVHEGSRAVLSDLVF